MKNTVVINNLDDFKENVRKLVESTKDDLHSLKEGFLVPYEDSAGCIEHIGEIVIEWIEEGK